MPARVRTVLLVDDSAILRQTVRGYFEEIGFLIVGEAENGAIAVTLASQLRPDLVVLDFSMPVMNGLQAAALVLGALPATIIVLFTAHADSATLQEQALALGVCCVISKSDPAVMIDRAQELTRHLA